ncbi:MAG: carboxylesterase family protein, partial [Bacteroidota bacterium]
MLMIIYTVSVHAQRYENQIFNEVTAQTVIYSKEKGLEMDIYQPAGDSRADRPVILFVHGGGFAGGARDEPEIIDFCKNMARRGIVTVSITYTLVMKGKSFSCDRPAEEKLWTFKHVGME